MLVELQEEITRNEEILGQLEDTLNQRRDEGIELDQLLADRDAEIRELEAQLEELNRNRPVEVAAAPVNHLEEIKEVTYTITTTTAVVGGEYKADMNDEVDKLLAQFINFNTCPVPVKRLGGGYYLFGTRKIYAKVLNGRLVIRVGGGYMIIDEFISTYAEAEVTKMEARRAKGLDPVPDIDGDYSPNRSFGSPSNRSPTNKTLKSNNSGSKSPGGDMKKSFMGATLGASSMNGTTRSRKIDQEKLEQLRAKGVARVIYEE